MRFEAEGRVVGAELDTVYEIIRDRLPELVPFMDNVADIRCLERGDGPTGPKLLNQWRADPGQVPAAARKFIKPEMLEWLDHAQWDDAEHHVDWRIESAVFKDMYKCTGRNRIVQRGQDVVIIISGEMIVNPSKIPGVPTFLAKRAVPTVEGYLIERMKPNMASLGAGVQRFLAAG